MKTERELFVKYMISENPSNNIEFMCEFGWFFDPITELRWQAWQASAQREGYKLVPVNPTDEMINTYRDKSIAPISTLSVIGYKAMIGAIE